MRALPTMCLFGLLASAGGACRRAAATDSDVHSSIGPAGPPAAPGLDAPTDASPATGPPRSPRFGAAATPVRIRDLGLGQFVIGDPPSAEHPRGTLAVLAGRYSPDDQQFVVTIDLSSLAEIGRVPIGPESTSVMARASTGLIVAVDEPDAIAVIRLDAGSSVAARHRVPKAPPDHGIRLRGFAAIGDRLVVVIDDNDGAGKYRVVALVVDDQARVVARHVCRGGLFSPSPPATIEAWGHQAVLTGLRGEDQSQAFACAFGLDAGAGTNSAQFPGASTLLFRDGNLFLETDTSGGAREAHRLGDDLRPTGPALDPKLVEPPQLPTCTAITGTATWQKAMVGGLLVTRTVSCCGDPEPAGVWVCDPAAREREGDTL
jgi:hypothetical protein